MNFSVTLPARRPWPSLRALVAAVPPPAAPTQSATPSPTPILLGPTSLSPPSLAPATLVPEPLAP
jgi:hypothetical protein